MRHYPAQELSTGLWDTIGQDHTHTIDRLFLGGRGTFWGVIDIPDDGLEEFSGGGVSRLSRYFNTSAQGASYQALLQDSSKYIVPGHAGPTFAIKDSQGVRLKGTRKALTDVLTSVGDHTVNSIVLSASDSKHWLLILEDGNVEYSLPQSVLDVVLPYCKPQHSLMMSKKKARQKQGQDVTTLQLVEGGSEYASVRNLFSKGWKHPHKRPLPNIEKIYSVTLPPNLQKRYLDYRADDYVANDTETEFRVMLLAKVVTGKVHKVWRTDQSMTAPQHPYDSVSGEVGVDLNYDEQVVYRDDAIIPAYLVVYNTKH
ncbi:hypothetical protein FRB99_001699 [Tulasnella sp. 403]|nr:hypothetical protein FRB99_001699 [Tulasnella sp. 403]